jgi:hypothetical protein
VRFETLLLRSTEDYVTFAVHDIVAPVRAARVVAVVGGPGAGRPPWPPPYGGPRR